MVQLKADFAKQITAVSWRRKINFVRKSLAKRSNDYDWRFPKSSELIAFE